MENPFSPLSTDTSNATTKVSKPKMGCSQNSPLSSICGPLNHPSSRFPQAYPLEHAASAYRLYPFWIWQNGIEIHKSCFLQPNGLSIGQERRVLDAYKTKVARIKRKLSRQRSVGKSFPSGANSSQVDIRRSSFVEDSQSTINRDLYKFCTSDNKRLRVLLSKELKNSDVGSLGRIVLPKREAEENLPILSDKEGIQVVIRDVNSNKDWSLKFKFWCNNKSRMYVLENTGDFVKQNGLEIGDSLTLYEDECKNLYFSFKKLETPQILPSYKQRSTNYLYIPHMYQDRDEEEASLALLIEQLNHKEQQESNSLVTLSMDISSSYRHKEEERNGPFNNETSISINPEPAPAAMQPTSMQVVDDHYIDDCYTGLGVLPDVNSYNFSL
ncbi:hypothetical protein P3X46_020302 [Hevea brasiliensis]|uniref:TF-B3 domain-containing protein n=1 Tax=Hevea brasiliensis TaxID=3981 RepID=A0ABQ9LQ84_HEVBR|nr:hypothetical protein P3X46_020302 [Hevea brasiliensis]